MLKDRFRMVAGRRAFALASLCFLTFPAWPQGGITCGGITTGLTGNDFFTNFANPADAGVASAYEIPIPKANGATAAGDLNSTYFPFYYSIANANATPCNFELVIVGAFPDARYFSITENDMHYTATQHLADADIDPANASTSNPFVPGTGGFSPEYNGNQQYVVPINLGHLPGAGAVAACAITPFEEDNLLDATQRHLSSDWNTSVLTNVPNVDNGLLPHVVDTPGHSNPNTAGSVIIRSYLAPETCTGTPGSGSFTCSPSPAAAQPYVIVRDGNTGCAYPAAYLENNNLVNFTAIDCAENPPAGCNAILSTRDLSAADVPNWLDVAQQTQHTDDANITSQGCYADGDPTVASPLPFANRLAWTRAAEWNGSTGPDSSYIGAAVSVSDLAALPAGSDCPQEKTGDGCVMRFRFRLPMLPDTPCPAPYDCSLSASAQLRYMSLTFWYQTAPPPDAAGRNDGNSPISIVSIADSAFAASDTYVTLIVNAGATLPTWLQQMANGASGVTQGVWPVTNKNDLYSLWTVGGYTVLDLGQFSAFNPAYPLLVTLRNMLPGATFNCSGSAVPFFTAEYTNADKNGGGLMGPYVPLVDYMDPNYLVLPAPKAYLPAESSCGVLPITLPGFNRPALPDAQVAWPNQYWSSIVNTPPPNLYCPTTESHAPSPAIDFVATQFPTPALTYFGPGVCNILPNLCSQIIVQSAQTSWQPALPVTIVGTGFGFLPNVNLPLAVQDSPYLEISDAEASGGSWNTATAITCQMYIADWTETSISLAANLPAGATDAYGVVLSPVNDVSPMTFAAAAGCPVAPGDLITFKVTNPQSGTSVTLPNIPVDPAGTAPF